MIKSEAIHMQQSFEVERLRLKHKMSILTLGSKLNAGKSSWTLTLDCTSRNIAEGETLEELLMFLTGYDKRYELVKRNGYEQPV